jgi:hypothetical protein
MSVSEPVKMRGRLDMLTIAQALARLPKLKLVMLGRRLGADGQPV